MAKMPRFLIPEETFNKIPDVVLRAIQDDTKTSLYGARVLLEAYSLGTQEQLVDLGILVAAGKKGKR